MGKIMRCDAVIESLPWHLNGSLGPEESAAIREHLEHCPACRAELAATAKVGRLHLTHPSAEEAVSGTMEGPVSAPLRPARRWLAAAALVGALISAGVAGGGAVLLWQHVAPHAGREPAGPRAGHPVIELLPEELAIRGDVPVPPVPRLPADAKWATVLLSAPGVPLDGVYRVELRQGDATLWRSGPTAPDDLGTFSLLLPAKALRGKGRSFVVVSDDAPPGAKPVAIYRLP